ncbi:hypothetical protein P280DRAFT_471651 [Massarina eburnea CBS 473.64]|uniref:Uncharacterized protein n=1 Tax=Massarina eburnea CBS 473.64 TaxID=1395130 RepID=A0A6A6RRB5_9PLEO|nr:hypothetical protein P280DRAFT_471651 [Massarina eburnea CBS 473.64]
MLQLGTYITYPPSPPHRPRAVENSASQGRSETTKRDFPPKHTPTTPTYIQEPQRKSMHCINHDDPAGNSRSRP